MSPKSNKSKQNSQKKQAQGEPARSSLPFEPASTRKKTPKKAPSAPEALAETEASGKSAQSSARHSAGIPQVVSQRMARRMGFFCGLPTSLGMLTFIVSYFIVTNQWFKLPNIAVVLVSMGFFGLGVLGLSYGVLSASWDEERVGSWHGREEFSTNFGRLLETWRSARQKPSP